MPNNEAFHKDIIKFQKLIQVFLKNYNSDLHTNLNELNQQLLEVRKITIPIIKSYQAKSTDISLATNDDTDKEPTTCNITSVRILEPLEYKGARRFVLPKGAIQIQIETDTTTCSIDSLDKKVVYSNGKEENAQLNNVSRQGKIIKASIPIDFTGLAAKTTASVKIGTYSSERVMYIPSSNVDVSSDKAIKDTVENYTRWAKTMNLDYSNLSEKDMTVICPSLSIKDGEVVVVDFEKELHKIPFVQKIQGGLNLQTLPFGDLENLVDECSSIAYILRRALASISYYNDILNGLGALVEDTETVQLSNTLNQAYKKQCTDSQNVLTTINNQINAIADFKVLVMAELIAKSIPEDLIKQSNALKEMVVRHNATLDPILTETNAYFDGSVTFNTFQEWKAVLDRINPICAQAQAEWDTPWNALKAAVASYETNNPEGAKNKYYTQWKRTDYKSLQNHIVSEQDPTISTISTIKYTLQSIQDAVDKTGGDGTMEFAEGENIVSLDEKNKFKDKTIATTFDFEDTGKPVFKDGPQKTDVKQGQVGDCYLMSALISLTKDNSDLLRSMIDDQGDKCVVTLHQGGVPIKVEVDKKLIIKKMPGYVDSTPAAQYGDDIWVAIIEKAYAKLLGSDKTDPGGNLIKIEGGSTTQALEVLLGNKVKTPKEIYLDANGAIVQENPTETVTNPIVLSNIKLDVLKKVVKAANDADYEIHVSSPDKYKGYTLGDHDILPIDAHHYMSFNHAYSLVDATNNTVTIRNPHGDSEREQGLFSESVKIDVTNLITAIEALEKDYTTNASVDKSKKTAMDNAIKAINENTLIASRFSRRIGNWNDWIADLVLDNNDNKWKPNGELRSRAVRRLGTRITDLKENIVEIADHKDKNNKLRDGFLNKTVRLNAEQTITYEVLKEYFDRVNLSIINP
ncbi:C2 family cysteine protease [Aureispira sp. CCB-E]|uniref:C2 family cysteine protease n=1 Tax=Aureispira sp. CCB-E TaxID=3051121 RepID=UPI0028684C7E|nr:C2 family cysteine protease [Aureispira sp. CCB-E]WMX17415.1 C2 family cysteine protease [Aureispira sp. CCB-E]